MTGIQIRIWFYDIEIANADGAFVSETAEIEFKLEQITP